MDDAQIIQDLIEGARRAGARVQVKSSEDVYALAKYAGIARALDDLGLEKEAFLGGLAARAAAWAPKLWQGLKTFGGTAKNLAGSATNAATQQFGRVGQAITGAAQKAGLSDKGLQTLRNVGRGAARDAALGAGLGGAIGAVTAEPGEGLGGFFRGAAGGALGGAAWRAGSNAARMGMGRALQGTRLNMGNLYRTGAQGSGWQRYGAKALTAGVPLVGGMAAASMMPTFDKQPQQPPPGMMSRFGY